MCLAVPARLISIGEQPPLQRKGRVEIGGLVKEVNLAFVPEAQTGDFVLIHFGHNDARNSRNYPDRTTITGGGDETIEIGGMLWELLHVPGHSPGSIALYNPDKYILIPGDVVYADYAIGRFDFHGASGRELRPAGS